MHTRVGMDHVRGHGGPRSGSLAQTDSLVWFGLTVLRQVMPCSLFHGYLSIKAAGSPCDQRSGSAAIWPLIGREVRWYL